MAFHVMGGKVVAEVAIEKPSGQEGLGCFRLVIPLRWTTYHPESGEARIFQIEGEVLMDFQGASNQYLGLIGPHGRHQLIATTPVPQMATQYTYHALELEAAKIEAIERRRQGGDVVLHVEVQALVEGEGGLFQGYGKLTCPIEQGAWVRILEGMGYRKSLLLEIPLPTSNASDVLLRGGECLKRAQDALHRGHYEDVVAPCRKTVESIRESVQESGERSSKFTNLPEDVKNASKVQREGLLRYALWVLTNPAAHADANAVSFVWNREDAIMILTAVAAEYRRIVESTIPE